MRVEFVKGNLDDFDELVDFSNYVFSHSGGATDFPSLLPKLYKKEYNTMNNHYIVKEDGKIKASIGAFPMELQVLDEKIKVIGIGTVAVHPYSRGNGYMKQLMNRILDDMKKDGVDLSCLGGQRQRYEYFSYTPCGEQFNFSITSTNIRHKLGNNINKNISFEFIHESKNYLLDKAYELYCSKDVKVSRDRENFLDILNSWNRKAYIIKENEAFIGYIVEGINEFIINDDNRCIEILASYMNNFNLSNLYISLPPYEKEKIKQLKLLSESYSVGNNYNFTVINYENVIRALLKLKTTYEQLLDGQLNINIKGYGTLSVSVLGSKIRVERTEDKEDISMTHLEVMDLVFSPIGVNLDLERDLALIVKSWFPLPLYIDTQDNV